MNVRLSFPTPNMYWHGLDIHVRYTHSTESIEQKTKKRLTFVRLFVFSRLDSTCDSGASQVYIFTAHMLIFTRRPSCSKKNLDASRPSEHHHVVEVGRKNVFHRSRYIAPESTVGFRNTLLVDRCMLHSRIQSSFLFQKYSSYI